MMINKWLKQLTQTLASMQTAIYLLLIVGVVSALGTFIPQGQTPTFYMQHYGEITSLIINGLGLGTLYHVWWFQLLIILLCLSILTCAYQRLRRVKKITVLASLLMHLAVVFILIGALWSLGYSHSSFIEIARGQTVSLNNYGFENGRLTLNDFKIDYYPDFQPRQYSSDLSLINYKGKNIEQSISVNHPLKAGSLKIYQSTWGWVMQLTNLTDTTGTIISLKDKDYFLFDEKEQIKVQAIFLPDFEDSESGIHSKSPLPNHPHVWLTLLQQGKIVDMAIIPVGDEVHLGSYHLRFDIFFPYSGLQIKQDSGVYMVFAGFIILLAGLGMRYWFVFMDKKGAN
ncbi:MAG: cytochrome c biogenesis protein ResB [Syntrophomonadaceae bacterium]|nr:cytochrome c biogenesis protein ResB [Syntrophomonadaceae bacterium]